MLGSLMLTLLGVKFLLVEIVQDLSSFGIVNMELFWSHTVITKVMLILLQQPPATIEYFLLVRMGRYNAVPVTLFKF